MTQKQQMIFFGILAIALTGGCVVNPGASAFGLLIVFAAVLADKYFTRNVTDSDREEIQTLKADFQKMKLKIDQESLSKAFSR